MKSIGYQIFNTTKIVFGVIGCWIIVVIILFSLFNYVLMPAFVGRFSELVEISNYVGLGLNEATVAIHEKDLNYHIDTAFKFSSNVPKNHVLKQRPKQGLKVKKNRIIWLEISKGLHYLKIPELIGVSLRQLKIILQQENLKLGKITFSSHEFVPKGVVYFSEPGKGVSVPRESKVNVSISTGKPFQEEKINLVGWSLNKAKKWLNKNSYIMGEIVYTKKEDILPNTILKHYPSVIILKNRERPIFLEVSK